MEKCAFEQGMDSGPEVQREADVWPRSWYVSIWLCKLHWISASGNRMNVGDLTC